MATLYTHQSENVHKTWALMTVFFAVTIALGWVFSWYFNNPGILVIFVIISIVMNVVSYWYSDTVVIKLSGAKPADGAQYLELNRIVENLAITAGLPKPKVYVIDDNAPNAFATGRDKNHAAVAVTSGLLEILDKTELEGVRAHELSHVGNRDMLVSTVAVVLAGTISIASQFFLRSLMFGGGRNNDREGGNNAIFMIVGIVLAILAPVFATIAQFAISRKREFLADASGALLTRYPEGLASALRKIGNYSAPMQRQSNAIAHLYIADPTGGRKIPWMSKLFMTHPPIPDRIKALTGNQ